MKPEPHPLVDVGTHILLAIDGFDSTESLWLKSLGDSLLLVPERLARWSFFFEGTFEMLNDFLMKHGSEMNESQQDKFMHAIALLEAYENREVSKV